MFNVPTPTTQKEDLETIRDFFGIPATQAEMQHLTGASHSQLGRILQGESAPSYRAHMAIVAVFIRELTEIMQAMSGVSVPKDGNMHSWLYSGEVQTTTGGIMTPYDALDAKKILHERLLMN